MINADAIFDAASAALQQVKSTQWDTIQSVAQVLADRIASGGVVHVFGTGHSRAFAMELSNRAGGLVPMHAMAIDDLLRTGTVSSKDIDDPTIERDPNLANALLAAYDVRSEDGAIVVSNSGRNGAIVEMALQLKSRGLPVVCVTSLTHTTQVTSRHPSGKRLFEVADFVIDNCAPYGDAALYDPRLAAKVCSISSITGGVIAQALTAEITRCLLTTGEPVPVLMSANVDGADAYNQSLRNKYHGRI